MDNITGWHAYRRAQKEEDAFMHPQRGEDGRFMPVEQITPMDENFIGGFHPHVPSRAPSPAPPLPPKDRINYAERPQPTVTPAKLTQMSAIERSRTLRVARMNPHLQVLTHVLSRYDTIDEQGIWHGAALVVTTDAGSSYEPHPSLRYEWDPDSMPSHGRRSRQHSGKSFDLGPHPADPHSTVIPTTDKPNGSNIGPNYSAETVPGQEIHVHGGNGGTFTFWRFMIRVPLGSYEMPVSYSINNGQKLHFYVPGRNQNMRWAAYSCNGFSAGFQSGYDPCWVDLLTKHAEQPFHVLVGGGDQLYCDGLTREPELQDWVSKMKPEDRKAYPLTDEIKDAVDRFYFNHYCQSFRSGAFARANSSMYVRNLAIFYPDDMQMAPVFRNIGSRGYFYFLLFQCFLNVEIDGVNDAPGYHNNPAVIIGDIGPYITSRSHSFLGSLGPQVSILLLDCRCERKKDQVCSPYEYEKVFQRVQMLPPTVEHLVVQLGIPIAYPRMVFLETALESKFNPLVAMGRSGTMGLSGFVNKFNAEAELLDDLNDHWTSRSHKRERNWLIGKLQEIALAKRLRITFLSGDVHCGAIGLFKTLKLKNKAEIPPPLDHRYMINVVTSAIVNTPPPNPVITMVSSLATKVHRTLHHMETDETMIPLFAQDTDGSSRKSKHIMGRRNWCSIGWDDMTGDLVYDLRVEKEKGMGESVGYTVRSPAPRWGYNGKA
ncbi:hypothetical protein BDZ89DRAFT_1057108 [Hymenopellis radicata]|nr:hypothetical protein BDZ89DRAFT_1057108 [Hymenopellis radicata]